MNNPQFHTSALKFALSVLVLFIGSLIPSASAAGFTNESLHYVITYKWGLVTKDAGEATLSLRNKGDRYSFSLTARTKPWADKFFTVRDTLLASAVKSTASAGGFRPSSYTKIAHEGGAFSRDELQYTHSGNKVMVKTNKVKTNKKGETSKSSKTLSATGAAFDMLSVFYYLRNLDYAHLSTNKEIIVSIFSGSKVETLTIRYAGREQVKLRNGVAYPSYHIRFKFTTAGKKKSSEDINTWISTDSRHIPLKLVGKLPVGQVQCWYLP